MRDDRTKVAFWVAPLCVPALIAPLFYFAIFEDNLAWTFIGTALSAAVTYAGMAAFGIPGFRFFKSKGLLRFWIALAYGFCCGVLTWLIFLMLVFPSLLGENPFTIPRGDTLSSAISIFDPVAGIVGVLVTMIFWMIARPVNTSHSL